MPGPLDNAKHERFAQLRAKGLTADQAYIQAGYNAHTGNAHRLSVNERVCSRVKEILGAVETRTVVTKARVIEELAKMGFANMLDYMQLHDDGTAAVDFSRLSRDQAAAIQSVEVEQFMDGGGEGARPVRKIKFKLADKKAALSEIARMMGWVIQKTEVGAPGDFDDEEDPRVLRAKLAALAADLGVGPEKAAAARKPAGRRGVTH